MITVTTGRTQRLALIVLCLSAPASAWANEMLDKVRVAQQNLKQLFGALGMYQNFYGSDTYPQGLSAVFELGFAPDPLTFWHPGDSDAPPTTISGDIPNAPNSAAISFAYQKPALGASLSTIIIQDNDADNNAGLFVNAIRLDGRLITVPHQPELAPPKAQIARTNLQALAWASQMYANDNGGYFPTTLDMLWSRDNLPADYAWHPGDQDPEPTQITNNEPNQPDSAQISFACLLCGLKDTGKYNESALAMDNTPANNAGLGVFSVRLDGTIFFTPVCAGDIDGDRQVTDADLGLMLSNLGTVETAELWEGDANGDGSVSSADLSYLLDHFGQSCR